MYCSRCGHSLKEEPRPLPQLGKPTAPPTGLASSIKESFVSLFRPMPPIAKPSMLVYEKLPSYTPIKKYVYIGVALTFFGIILWYSYPMVVYSIHIPWLQFMGAAIAGFAAPLVYLFWIYRNDRFEREPLPLIALTFGWGAISPFLIFVLYYIFPLLDVLPAAIAAPVVEEPLKILGVFWLAKHPRLGKEFNDHLDGIVFGAAAGAGFAGIENILYILKYAPDTGFFLITLLRSLPMHLVYTALAGRWLGLAKVRNGRIERIDLIPGLAVAMVLHGLWNLGLGLIWILMLLVLYVYVLHKLIKEAWRDEMLWGYAEGYAPVE